MAEQWDTRESSGSLFPIRGEKKSERHPDYTGEIRVNGQLYWLSGWLKTSRTGIRWLSVSLTVKEDRQAQQGSSPQAQTQAPQQPNPWSPAPKPPRGPTFAELDDDVPF